MSNSDEIPSAVKKEIGGGIIILLLIVILIGCVIFAIFYYKRYKSSDGWNVPFRPPAERDLYFTFRKACDFEDDNQFEELKKLLVRRAIATIPIITALQNEGNSIERLYKKGMLTDDMHFKIKEMKAFVDQEVQDIQFEANSLVDDWGNSIWPQAFHFHNLIQQRANDKNDEQKSIQEEKKMIATERRKEKVKKQKELSDARKLKENSERIAQELIEEEENLKAKRKTK